MIHDDYDRIDYIKKRLQEIEEEARIHWESLRRFRGFIHQKNQAKIYDAIKICGIEEIGKIVMLTKLSHNTIRRHIIYMHDNNIII